MALSRWAWPVWYSADLLVLQTGTDNHQPARSTDWTALLAIFGTGIALAVAILPGLGDIARLAEDMAKRYGANSVSVFDRFQAPI